MVVRTVHTGIPDTATVDTVVRASEHSHPEPVSRELLKDVLTDIVANVGSGKDADGSDRRDVRVIRLEILVGRIVYANPCVEVARRPSYQIFRPPRTEELDRAHEVIDQSRACTAVRDERNSERSDVGQ